MSGISDNSPTLQGGTDQTLIGNDGDRLKVSSSYDTNALDAFGRLRVSSTISIFAYHHAYSKGDLLWNEATSGTASSTHSTTFSSVLMTVGTANGDSIIRQTKRYARYVPGKSAFVTLALTPGAAKTNVRKRWGAFDVDSGFFFQQTSSSLSVVLRQFLTGSAVDIVINQTDWNMDKFDGAGSSGITLDVTKHNVFVVDFTWHGSGLVRFGLLYNGRIVYCHQIQASNTYSGPYSRYPAHPCRFEITNTGTTESSTTLQVTAVSANKEGTEEVDAPYIFSASNEATSRNIGSTTRPILSLRLNPTFNGAINRVIIQPLQFETFSVQNAGYIQVLLNPTLTGASWVNVNTSPTNNFSSAQKDVSATAVSGGTVLFETYISGGGKGVGTVIQSQEPAILSTNIAGTNSDILTVTFTSFGGGTDVYTAIAYKEFQ